MCHAAISEPKDRDVDLHHPFAGSCGMAAVFRGMSSSELRARGSFRRQCGNEEIHGLFRDFIETKTGVQPPAARWFPTFHSLARWPKVYQLFFQDGLQPKSSSISQGTLGAHIVQDEAGTAAGKT